MISPRCNPCADSLQLVFDWRLINDISAQEPQRPEFVSTEYRRNPVTGVQERNMPKSLRIRRYFVSAGVILFMIALVVAAVIGVIVYRLAVTVSLKNWLGPEDRIAKNGPAGGCVYLCVCLCIIGRVA